jgi:hypothetical protein
MNFIRNLLKQTESLSVIANIAEDPRFQIVKHDSFTTKYSMEHPPIFVTTLREISKTEKYRVVQTPQMVAHQKELGRSLRGKDIMYSDRLYAKNIESCERNLKVSPYIIETSSNILLGWQLNKL